MPGLHPPSGNSPSPQTDLKKDAENRASLDAVHDKSECRDTVLFAGDQQYHAIPYNWGLYRSQAINSEAPGHRLPASNSGLFAGHEALIRQSYVKYLPKECREKYYKGIISMGDTTDIATVEEFNSFLKTQDRLQKHNRMHRIWAYLIGNHEVLHAGTARTGSDFFGVLGWFLKLEGKRTYKKDIQLPEVGAVENVLNKEKLITLIYSHFSKEIPHPTVVTETSDSIYKINNGSLSRWSEHDKVYKNFWKQAGDDVWQLLVRVRPNGYGHEFPEAEWIYAPAIKLGKYQTTKGALPLYMIGLDTMDYSDRNSNLAAINGHVSALQIKAVKSFIEQKKKEDPLAKFILAAHYKPTSIEEVRSSGLSSLLEDEAIVAVVGAHHHKRDFADLSTKSWQEELGMKRKAHLPEITVPAIIDGPNELTGMRYGLKEDQLVLEFDFMGIDTKMIPEANDSEVLSAYQDMIPRLLTYRDAIKHIKDARLREFALPGTSILRKVQLILHPDFGLIADSGRIHDHIIAHDVLPTMVEDAQLYLRIAENVLYLTLTEAGLKSEGEKLRTAYYENQDILDDYYEKIFRGEYTQLIDHSPFHRIDEKTEAVEDAVQEVNRAIKNKLDNDPTTTNKQRELLEKIRHVVADTHRFQENYKYWLQRYENLKRSDRDDADMVFAADLFASGYFRSIQQHIEWLPYGSKAHAFMTLIFLESAKQRDLFYGKDRSKKVPDHIELRVNIDGSRTLNPTGKITPTPQDQGGDNQEYAQLLNPKLHPSEEFRDPPPEDHWVLRAGGAFLQGNGSFVAEFGGRWHLLEGLNVPRLSWEMVTGLKSDGPFGIESPLHFAFNIGDPLGLIDVGPLFGGGLAYEGKAAPYLGIGGQVNIREGLLTFNFMHKWYYDVRGRDWNPNWALTFNTDIFTWLRFWDVLPASF